jgi:CRISPR system Cascade subunit CasC
MSGPSVFVEFHALTSHVPANLNRDELGTPKTALFGDTRRLRISSQCLKRTWRTSPYFRDHFEEQDLGIRTARLPQIVLRELGDLPEAQAKGLIGLLGSIGKASKKSEAPDEDDSGEDGGEPESSAEPAEAARTAHLLFLTREEIEAVKAFAKDEASALATFGKSKKGGAEALKSLRQKLQAHMEKHCKRNAVDVALFGRFVTSDEIKTIDAAMQVAHALGTQSVKLEYDYFSAVDDQQPKEEQGAGHIGETEFAASVFYKYAVCDFNQLRENLGDEARLAPRSLKAIAVAIARAIPTGKKNSTAPQNPADYLEVVVRRDSPLSLANAFLKPVRATKDEDVMDVSIRRLQEQRDRYHKAYTTDADVLLRTVLCLRDIAVTAGTPQDSLIDLAKAVEAHLEKA